jgi:hypothetical protein
VLLYIAYNLLKGRPENRDQRASQSTATIKLEYKTLNCAKPLSAAAGGAASNQQTNKQTNKQTRSDVNQKNTGYMRI